MIEEKKCTKCKSKKEKSITNFHRDKNRNDGYFPWCKVCVSIGTKKYRENNKEKISEAKKQRRKNNRGAVCCQGQTIQN